MTDRRSGSGSRTLRSAARLPPDFRWRRVPNSTIVSSTKPMVVEEDSCLVLGDSWDVDVKNDRPPTTPIGKGEYTAHTVGLPGRDFPNVVDPYGVFCRSNLNPLLLATIVQRADHDYLRDNTDRLEEEGHLFYNTMFRNRSCKKSMKPENDLERFLDKSFSGEVNRIRRADWHHKGWIALKGKYRTTLNGRLVAGHLADTVYVSLRGSTFDTKSCTVNRTHPMKMTDFSMGRNIGYHRMELYTFNDQNQQTSYALNVPGTGRPLGLIFFNEDMGFEAVVFTRRLNPPQPVSLRDHVLSTTASGSTRVSSSATMPVDMETTDEDDTTDEDTDTDGDGASQENPILV